MAKESAYERYIEDLKKREQDLRDEIEQQSTKLESKVKTGVIIGLVAMVLATVYFAFFRGSSKKHKRRSKSKGNWILRSIIETVGMDVVLLLFVLGILGEGFDEKYNDVMGTAWTTGKPVPSVVDGAGMQLLVTGT